MSNCQICNKITNIMSKYEIKIAEEKEFLYKFLQTIVGKNLFNENNITKIVKSEAPDFLLETYDSRTLALEITQFIAQNKNLHYSQALTRIGNQLCDEIKKDIILKYQYLLTGMIKESLVQIGMIILI